MQIKRPSIISFNPKIYELKPNNFANIFNTNKGFQMH